MASGVFGSTVGLGLALGVGDADVAAGVGDAEAATGDGSVAGSLLSPQPVRATVSAMAVTVRRVRIMPGTVSTSGNRTP
jgi:hypothetical protein